MTTLENSYCVPRTVEEWDMLAPYFPEEVEDYGSVNAWRVDYIRCGYIYLIKVDSGLMLVTDIHDLTEIPVTRFLDLLHDRICPWRLEEHGFNNPFGDTYTLRLEHDWDGIIVTRVVRVIGGKVSVNGDDVNITTFTDLLHLIRMLTPTRND